MGIRTDRINSLVSSCSIPANSSPRPPTPPCEPSRTHLSSPPRDADSSTHALSPSSTAAPELPASSADSTLERCKTVKWTAELATITFHDPDAETPITPSKRPATSSISEPLKSILKAPQPLPPSPGDAPLSVMLQSFVEALSGTDRGNKLDQYVVFCNTLKAYDEIPDLDMLEARMPILIGFLKRDMEAKMNDGEKQDSQIMQQAIKLLSIFVWTPRLLDAIDERSLHWFLQRIIQSLEDPTTSKSTIGFNLHILAANRIPARIMNADKVNRILSALENLDKRVQGKAIAKDRINVYIKLLSVAKPVMQTRVTDWMQFMFHSLFHTAKEVRSRALILLNDVARLMGGDKLISRAVTAIFSKSVNGHRMFDEIRQRLDILVKGDHEGVFVVRVWAAVILIVRGRDQWEYFNPWLRVIQTCFNVSDREVKFEAQLAWSKLIYAVEIGPGTTPKLLQLLCRPLEQYLDPKCSLKPRMAAFANISTLLYYGFRPNASTKQLSVVWDVVVVGLVEKLLHTEPEGALILYSILGNDNRSWSEKRGLVGPPLKPDEIPRLDPRWVRSHCSTVLKTIEASIWNLNWTEGTAISSRTIWTVFMKSLADAGAKEVKVSSELTDTVGEMLNLFERVWSTGSAISNQFLRSDVDFMEVFSFMVLTSLKSLGTLSFLDKPVSSDDRPKPSPSSTPSHQSTTSGKYISSCSPVIRLFKLFLDPAPGTVADAEYLAHIEELISAFVSAQDSRRKRLSLLASMVETLSQQGQSPLELRIWDSLALHTIAVLSLPTSRKGPLPGPSASESEFIDARIILKWGLPHEVLCWERLWNMATGMIRKEAGAVVVNKMFIEPLAESLQSYVLSGDLALIVGRAICLFENAHYPDSQLGLNSTTSGVSGSAERMPPCTSTLFPRLLELGNVVLKMCSMRSICNDMDSTALLTAVCDFLGRVPSGDMEPLRNVQEGLGCWVRDEPHLDSSQSHTTHSIMSAISTQWSKCLQLLEKFPRHDSIVLSHLSIFVACGFESRFKSVVASTIKTWNRTFGKQQSLQYTERLRTSIQKLQAYADINLPTFPASDDDLQCSPSKHTDTPNKATPGSPGENISSPTPISKYRLLRNSADPESEHISPREIRETPYAARPGSLPARKSMTPKQKHLDSQIQFVPIDTGNHADTKVSQITDHQKDVQVRQTTTARLYPELGVPPMVDNHESQRSRTPVSPLVPASLNDENPMEVAVVKSPKLRRQRNITSISAAHGPTSPAPIISELATNVPLSDAGSDEQSAEENFVDASDHVEADVVPFTGSGGDVSAPLCGDASPLDDIVEIAVQISPISQDARPQYLNPDSECSHAQSSMGPETQIVTEIAPLSGAPVRRLGGGSSRKRKRSAPETSPEVFDTIVLSAHGRTPSPRATSNSFGSSGPASEKSRAGKRTKFADLLRSSSDVHQQSTPVKRQRKSSKRRRTLGKPTLPKQDCNMDEISFVEETQINITPSIGEKGRTPLSTDLSQNSTPSRSANWVESTMFSTVTPNSRKSLTPASSRKSLSCQLLSPSNGSSGSANEKMDGIYDDSLYEKPQQILSPRMSHLPPVIPLQTAAGSANDPHSGQTNSPNMTKRAKSRSATIAMQAVRQALQLISDVDIPVEDIEVIEDEVFAVFSQLRKRRKLMS